MIGVYFRSVYDLYNRCARFIRLLYNNNISIQYTLVDKNKKKIQKQYFYNSILEVTGEHKLNNSPLIDLLLLNNHPLDIKNLQL